MLLINEIKQTNCQLLFNNNCKQKRPAYLVVDKKQNDLIDKIIFFIYNFVKNLYF